MCPPWTTPTLHPIFIGGGGQIILPTYYTVVFVCILLRATRAWRGIGGHSGSCFFPVKLNTHAHAHTNTHTHTSTWYRAYDILQRFKCGLQGLFLLDIETGYGLDKDMYHGWLSVVFVIESPWWSLGHKLRTGSHDTYPCPVHIQSLTVEYEEALSLLIPSMYVRGRSHMRVEPRQQHTLN